MLMLFQIPYLYSFTGMSDAFYKTKTVAELKNMLREQEMPVSGVKQDLVARLVQAELKGAAGGKV